MYNEYHGVFQGCTPKGWVGFHAATTAPPDCPNIGDTCRDGTIYAGLSPDGNVPMYAMPTDGPDETYTWNSGVTSSVDTAMENCSSTSSTVASCNTGRANTALLAALTETPAPYKAAQYCEGLVANGHGDWYLPSQNELKLLYKLYQAGKGGFVLERYWSSSENQGYYAWGHNFSGSQFQINKYINIRVRCVRR
ncbi:DUF1566 domain-containing protein [Pseudomonas aeruginosa]|uniref:Lcl domain-containing protein n=1 Tax=Pseudomonas aeruginosa TaxID=287 RepID=UPI003459C3B0